MIEFDIASIVPMIEWAGDNVTHRVIIFFILVTAIILLLLYIHPSILVVFVTAIGCSIVPFKPPWCLATRFVVPMID